MSHPLRTFLLWRSARKAGFFALVVALTIVQFATGGLQIRLGDWWYRVGMQPVTAESAIGVTGSGSILIGPGTWGSYSALLSSTHHELLVYNYDVTYDLAKTLFSSLADRGVAVSMILENHKFVQYQDSFKDMETIAASHSGMHIESDQQMGDEYMHAKVIVGDTFYTIATANFNKTSFTKNREHRYIGRDETTREGLEKLFRKDRSGSKLTLADIPQGIVVCPLNCRPVIEGLLESAQTDITIQTQYVLDDSIQQILIHSQVPKRIIVANTESNNAFRTYRWTGVVRALDDAYNHTKIIIIDHSVMLLGSMNMSANSLDNNREYGVIIRDPGLIAQVESGFEADWKTSE